MNNALRLLTVSAFVVGCALSARAGDKIGALGHVVPASGIITVGGPGGDVVDGLLAHQGDELKAGTPMAALHGRQSSQADLDLAKLSLRQAQTKGPLSVRMAQLKLKQATLDRDFAVTRLERFGKMDGEAISPQVMEQRRYQADEAQISFDSATGALEQAKADSADAIERAQKQLLQAQQKFDSTSVNAPFDCTVLDVLGHEGDPSGQALFRVANLNNIEVVADVYEGDILKVALGMKATISASALSAPVKGEVVAVGRIISDGSKVARVRIHLDDPAKVARLLNLEVNVSLEP